MLIFLPVRNGGNFLRTAIDSIIAQTTPDWRLVVLENGSTDDTVAIVNAYDDPRIELCAASAPLDIAQNWQRAALYLHERITDNPLVTFIGHDDYFLPSFVQRITALAAESPGATLYQAAFDLVGSDGRLIRPCRPVPESETWRDLAMALCWNLRDSFGTGYAFRARDFLQVGGIPALPMLLSADHLLFIRLAKLGYKRTDPRPGCAYRLHTGSTSGGMSRGKINAHVEALDRYVAALVDMELAATEEGRNALACLLGRELWTLRLRSVDRVLDGANRDRRDRLDRYFNEVARDVPAERWAEPEGGGFARLILPARRMARSASLYLQTRK